MKHFFKPIASLFDLVGLFLSMWVFIHSWWMGILFILIWDLLSHRYEQKYHWMVRQVPQALVDLATAMHKAGVKPRDKKDE